jgi:preprotein translocase subunit SecD
VTDGKGVMELGQDKYPVEVLENDSIRINNMVIYPSDNLTLNGIGFEYINQTQDRLQFVGLVYEGDDIEIVYTDPQRSGIVPLSDGAYKFFFTIQVSTIGAQRFADVTTGVPSYLDIQTGDRYLESVMLLSLDNRVVSELRISESLGGQIYQTPQITGVRGTLEEATAEMLKLQTILRSGAMPTGLETLSVSIISPTLGTEFFDSIIYALILAVIAVVIVIFIRYRNFRIALPMVLISLTEVVIILGIAAINDAMIWVMILIIDFLLISIAWWKKHEIDIYAWVGALLIPLIGMSSWTIDLPAIAGIIAAIGTGIDHQIIIADEAISGKKDEKDKDYGVKKRIKMAFFIIFAAAATTIAAMVPLMSIGIGFLRGFAITTIVGVLVGVMITRPAYAHIAKSVSEKK